MLVMRFSTAALLITSASAIPRLDFPSARWASTSRSRGLSRSSAPSGRRRPSIRPTTSGSSALPPAATRATASVKASTSPTDEEPRPADTEERMVQFAELLGTAIANADSRDQLRASRARLLTEGDEARRRVVRDLHDGAQQRQVHTLVTLKFAQQALRAKDADAESLVAEALVHAQQGNAELRELAHGILPSVLTRGGLGPAVDTLVARLDLPVEVDAAAERLPAAIEASAYFIVAEA